MVKLLHGNLVNITILLNLQNFAVSLVSVFVPLLLLQHGMNLRHICLYFLAYAVFKLAATYPSVLLIQKYGPRVGLATALCCCAAYLFSLNSLSAGLPTWTLGTTAATLALSNSFLWNSQHMHIANAMDSSRRGRDLAVIESLGRVMSLAAPLIGGVVIAAGGETMLLLVAVGMTIVGLAPALRIRVDETISSASGRLRYSVRSAPLRDVFANFCFNANTLTATMVWPVYLALTVGDFVGIGVINTVTTLVAVIVLRTAGRRGDNGQHWRVLAEATAFVSLANFLRLFAFSPLTIIGVGATVNVAGTYQMVPWSSTYYGHARDSGTEYVMAMEIGGDLATVAFWTVMLTMSVCMADWRSVFVGAFVLAAVTSWGVLSIRPTV